MADFKFTDSPFKFTDPIRYFKANDPYYWEVDNIPLQQLQENCKWLKDQVSESAGDAEGVGITSVKRGDIDELRPYALGNDRTIRVLPGRYTARINDAYDPEPMTYLSLIASGLGEIDKFNIITAQAGQGTGDVTKNTLLNTILNSFKTKLSTTAKNMNGLVERAFTYPMLTEDSAGNFTGTDLPSLDFVIGDGPFPLSEVMLWVQKPLALGEANTVEAPTYDSYHQGFAKLSFLESAFIKRWKGVVRTAIVDVAEEISIDIPNFDENDFFYLDDTGTKVAVPATQRIDLVFIYSKPVDTSAVTTGRYSVGAPTKINKPELGIVKGAGIGVDLFVPNSSPYHETLSPLNAADSDGNPMILPHVGDEVNLDNGFSALNIHGSFPAPDDLLNQAPLLSEELETGAYPLVGQTILPVAYILVKNDETVIAKANVIDIRPFFRTTELAYNERAGIAAANPQISFANPVVGKAQLDKVESALKGYVDTGVAGAEAAPFPTDLSRVVGAGMVFGGMNFGVEGTLAQFEYYMGNADNVEEAWANISDKNQYPDTPVPMAPDWDLATHANSLPEKGLHALDHISFIWNDGVTNDTPATSANYGAGSQRGFELGCYGSKYQADVGAAGGLGFVKQNELNNNGRLRVLGNSNHQNRTLGNQLFFVQKTIAFSRDLVPWMSHYDVSVQLHNCIHQSDRGYVHEGVNERSGACGIWIDRKKTNFTIYVAWEAAGGPGESGDEKKTSHGWWSGDPTTDANRDKQEVAGFWVCNAGTIHHPIAAGLTGANQPANLLYEGEPLAGAAYYPTVAFQIIGHPVGTYRGNLNAQNPVIELK